MDCLKTQRKFPCLIQERARFLIQKQRVGKYRTKHCKSGIVFIVNILRHSSFWWPFYFKSFQMLKFAATHHEKTVKTNYQLFSKNV